MLKLYTRVYPIRGPSFGLFELAIFKSGGALKQTTPPGNKITPSVDAPQHIHVRTSSRAITRHDALGTDLAAATEFVHHIVDNINNVLAADLELHSAAGPTGPLDAKGARAIRQDLAVAGNAVLVLGGPVALDIPNDLLAVRHRGGGTTGLVLKRRVAAPVLGGGGDVAGVFVAAALGACFPRLEGPVGAADGEPDKPRGS